MYNYNTRVLCKARNAYTFAITEHLKEHLIKSGKDKDTTFVVPNMISINSKLKSDRTKNDIPIIGSMGRFVRKKGFDIFLKALNILRSNGVKFKAVLAGEGEEMERLLSLSKELGLEEVLSFSGWVENKEKFFSSIDIFCLPSLHEPFGIVLLEAFASKTPVISTNSEGPKEIIEPGVNGIIVDIADDQGLA